MGQILLKNQNKQQKAEVKSKTVTFSDEALWYKDAVIYQLHVKSFYDSNGDGIGDIRGITEKLDHLDNLGITAIWVLPFYPSPLKDDGYDISDYYNIHPDYGTLRDFKELLKEAHARDIKVITELVINHTSDQHAWFQRARRAKPGSAHRDFYVWSETQEKFKEARIIFKDFESSNWSWDALANAYYWHRFYSHQPDLNFDNPQVQKEIFKIADFWFGMGVDGMRLDAIPYLFEEEGTNCENLPKTYEFLKKLRGHVERKFKNKMLLAEANQWPEDAVKYFGDGKACHMAFHFPLMPRMFMGLQMEDRFPIVDILEQTPAIADTNQWAIFLRNHDELTLEMVTDEERDYMYRVYAKDPRTKINLGIRRRLVPLLGNNRKKVELMNTLLFSLPGSPIIYYGDEIGMGDNYYLGDRNGVRTPMQWSSDKNAGFSKTNPQRLFLPVIIDPEYHFEAVNVENQESNLSSLFWWMRRVISMRKRYRAFSRGSIKFLYPDNPKILAFIREYENEKILVVCNLSRFSQVAEIEMPEFAEHAPEEVFSQNKFPIIKKSPYVLTMGPHDHFWLLLKKDPEVEQTAPRKDIPQLSVQYHWKSILDPQWKERVEQEILPKYLMKCRWFGRKASVIKEVYIVEKISVNDFQSSLLLINVSFMDGWQEMYFLPVSYAPEKSAQQILQEYPQSIIARVDVGTEKGCLYDGMYDEQLQKTFLKMIFRKKKIKAYWGDIVFYPSQTADTFRKDGSVKGSHLVKAEQSNTSVVYDNRFILKLFRRLKEGINPDLELTRYLTERKHLAHISSFLGAVEYRKKGADTVLVGLLSQFVPNQGDAWSFTLDELKRYYEYLIENKEKLQMEIKLPESLFDIDKESIPEAVQEIIGPFYIELANLLGVRTRELHDSLAGESEDINFTPESFSTLYQRSVYQSMRAQAKRNLLTLSQHKKKFTKHIRADAEEIIKSEKEITKIFSGILQKKYAAQKIRIHGDYHLGQVLFTGKDFVIIDFEGEPSRSISERRLKGSPLRDLAGMVRSFHYVAYCALYLKPSLRRRDIELLQPWAEVWYRCICGIFLSAYLNHKGLPSYLPSDLSDIQRLLNIYLLDKAIYELNYELNNRPDKILIPIIGIKNILKDTLAVK